MYVLSCIYLLHINPSYLNIILIVFYLILYILPCLLSGINVGELKQSMSEENIYFFNNG